MMLDRFGVLGLSFVFLLLVRDTVSPKGAAGQNTGLCF